MRIFTRCGLLEVQGDHTLELSALDLLAQDIGDIVLIKCVAAIQDPGLDAALGEGTGHRGTGSVFRVIVERVVQHVGERGSCRLLIGKLRHIPPGAAFIAHLVLAGISGETVTQMTDVTGQSYEQGQGAALEVSVIPLIVGGAVHDMNGLNRRYFPRDPRNLGGRHIRLRFDRFRSPL